MQTSTNQPYYQDRPRYGLLRVIGILFLIVVAAVWLLNSYKAGKPIPISQPMTQPADPVVVQTVAYDMPIRCIDISQPIKRLPGHTALTVASNYVECAVNSAQANYRATKSSDGYTITDPDGKKFLCSGIPAELTEFAQCKVVQPILASIKAIINEATR